MLCRSKHVTLQNRRIISLAVLAALGISALHAGVKGPAALPALAGPMPVQESQSSSETSGAGAQRQSPLNYEEYRTLVEAVFLKKREGGVRCYDCHSTLPPRLRLQPFLPGDSSWTEEQSRQNFEFVSQLVAPHAPLSSRLLLHPLAQAAGGDPVHAGGKFWKAQAGPEWEMLAAWVRGSSPGTPAIEPTSPTTNVLDFQIFESKIEPIFLDRKPGHARCYGCHSEYNRSFHLEKLSPDETEWTNEQSRKNFANVMQHVMAGDPTSSRLLMHPLAPESGGEAFH